MNQKDPRDDRGFILLMMDGRGCNMLMKRAELRQLFYLLIVCHLEPGFLPGGKSAIQVVKIGVAQLDQLLSCHPAHTVTFAVKDHL